MKALIFEGKIVQLSEKEFPVSAELKWSDLPAGFPLDEIGKPWIEIEDGEVSPRVIFNQAKKLTVLQDEELKRQEEEERKASLESNKRAAEARLKALEKTNPELFTAVQDMMFLATGILILPDDEPTRG